MKITNGNIGKSFKIVHWNLGSRYWDKKTEDIQHLVDELNPDITFISEANLFKGLLPHLRLIDGYNIVLTKDFDAAGYSRIVLLVKEDFQVTIQDTLMEDDISSIWLKVKRKGCRNITIGGVYREHRRLLQGLNNDTWTEDCQNQRWRRFLRQWVTASRDGHCIVIGDTNLDYRKWNSPEQVHLTMVSETKDEIETLNFSQVIEGITRSWPGTADSTIDQCWTNEVDKIISNRIIVRAVGDHNVLEVTVRLKGADTSGQDTLRRNWKKINIDRFKTTAASIHWEDIEQFDDLELANNWLEETLVNLLNAEAPWMKVQNRKGYRNWIKDSTKQIMAERDKIRESARIEKSQLKWNQYKTLRNECTKRIKQDKIDFFSNQYQNYENTNDTKCIYNLMKHQAGWKSVGPPKTFLLAGKAESSPLKMANAQMIYFHNKIQELQLSLPLNNTDPLAILDNALLRWSGTGHREQLELQTVTEVEVLEALKDMGNSTSCGVEGLDSISLKLLAPFIFKPLTFIANLSIQKSQYPMKWKTAKIVPIHKGKNKPKNLTSSYRPISLLPTISKLIERLVQKQLMKFMTNSKQININQHAYRSSHSTTSAICQLADELYTATDNNLMSTLLAVDQSSAFDTVDHCILLKKLEKYNCSQKTVEWLKNYLNFRTQFVSIGGKSSVMKPVTRGVPQGSILGPLLYVIYTNELSECMRQSSNCQHVNNDQEYLFGTNCSTCGVIISYADDSTLTFSSNSRPNNQIKLKEGLDNLENFLTSNKLAINRSKTTISEVMIGQKRARTPGNPPTLSERDADRTMKIIECQQEVRLLGATLTDNITWTAHIETGEEALLPAIRKTLGILKHIGRAIPTKSKKILAEGLIVSRLRYLISIWGGTSERNLSRTQALLNNTARLITNKGRRTSTIELMTLCNWLTVGEMSQHSSLQLLWKTIRLGAPKAMKDKFLLNQDNTVSTQEPRLLHTSWSWRCRAANLWNCLPDHIRATQSLPKFKSLTKNWIVSRREQEPD